MIEFVENAEPGNTIMLPKPEGTCASANTVAEAHGFAHIDALDIKNLADVLKLPGVNSNRLFRKDNIIYHFDHWTGEYPWTGILMREIGRVFERPTWIPLKNDHGYKCPYCKVRVGERDTKPNKKGVYHRFCYWCGKEVKPLTENEG